MFKNYFITAWRSLLRQRGYSLINILGLSVGLAAFILISLWVYNELSTNRHLENFSRIYRFVQTQNYATGPLTTTCMPGPLAAEAVNDFPDIETAFRFYEISAAVAHNDKRFIEQITVADSGIFRVFDFELIYGDLSHALSDLSSAVLTKSAAMKIYGHSDVVGELLRVNDTENFRILAIIEDPPKNSSFTRGIYLPFEYLDKLGQNISDYGWNSYYVYALLHKDINIDQFNDKFRHYFRKVRNDESNTTELYLFPLSGEYLYNYNGRPAAIKNIYTFGIIALFILLIACINFMNLSTARAGKRSREIGLRKVMGATRHQLIRQFLGESVLMAFLSLLTAIFLVELLLPVFNKLTGKELEFSLLSPPIIMMLVLMTLLTGLIAGSYPALFLSSFNPSRAMRSRDGSLRGHTWFRRGLVVFQFTLSVGLIICTLVIYRQLGFMLNKNLGMNKENVIYVHMRGDIRENFEDFKAELKRNPDVLEVSASSHLPFMVGSNSGGFSWQDRDNDDEVLINFQFVETDYPELMKLKLLSGRFFSDEYATDTACVLINQTCAALMGYDDPVGKWISWDGGNIRTNIIGLLEDFHIQKLHNEIPPLILLNNSSRTWAALIRVNGSNTESAIASIEDTWNSFVPAFPFEYKFLDKTYEKFYTTDKRLSRLIEYFAILAVIISCLGLFGLASFMAEQKTREIGIRKVLGASINGIITLQQKEFLWLVALGNVVAWPFSWYYMRNWLDGFAYKISLSPFYFIAAGGLSILITFLTVFFLAYRAALKNPVEAIKYE